MNINLVCVLQSVTSTVITNSIIILTFVLFLLFFPLCMHVCFCAREQFRDLRTMFLLYSSTVFGHLFKCSL